MSLNSIILMGRLTKDPELRYTPSNVPVCSFSIAVERDFSDKQSGEKITDFFDVTAWRATAEFIAKYFSKGARVCVQGRCQFRDWTDKEGNRRRATEVIAESVYFADSKAESGGTGAYQPQGYQATTRPAQSAQRASQTAVSTAGFDELADDKEERLPF